MILFFSDLHINETAQFSTATETGFSVRQLEGIQACQDVLDVLQDQQYHFEAVVFGGDLINKVGNNISASDLATVTKCITMIQQECIKQGITFYVLVGNHDIGANMLGFHKLIPFKCYQNVKIVDSFEIDGNYVFMPYVFDDSAADIFLNNIEDKQDKVVFSHLELKDVPLGNGFNIIEFMKNIKRKLTIKALKETDRNKTKAAQLLGYKNSGSISLKELDISDEDLKTETASCIKECKEEPKQIILSEYFI